jgi:hypothetical protein
MHRNPVELNTTAVVWGLVRKGGLLASPVFPGRHTINPGRLANPILKLLQLHVYVNQSAGLRPFCVRRWR